MTRLSILFNTTVVFLCCTAFSSASTQMSSREIQNVKRQALDTEELRKKIEKSAVLLANYEIEAKKLVRYAEQAGAGEKIENQARKLMSLSEVVIDSARFRLPQCDEYLAKSIALKNELNSISHESLEQDYHHDGALPSAPNECYHAKDLFVHPATVVVLLRDDPSLQAKTRASITAEIMEVLAHTEYVRQLVMY